MVEWKQGFRDSLGIWVSCPRDKYPEDVLVQTFSHLSTSIRYFFVGYKIFIRYWIVKSHCMALAPRTSSWRIDEYVSAIIFTCPGQEDNWVFRTLVYPWLFKYQNTPDFSVESFDWCNRWMLWSGVLKYQYGHQYPISYNFWFIHYFSFQSLCLSHLLMQGCMQEWAKSNATWEIS